MTKILSNDKRKDIHMDNENCHEIVKFMKGKNNDIQIKVIWDKYNSGLLCRKTFTWVDDYKLTADIKVNPSDSIGLVISFYQITGHLVRKIINYLWKRLDIGEGEKKQTIIIINNGIINIDSVRGISTLDENKKIKEIMYY